MNSKMQMVWPRPMRRKYQNEDQVTFKKSTELKLRNKVIDKSGEKVTPCMYEMSFVFSCLKENHFNEKECMDEVKMFRDCYMESIKKIQDLKLRKKTPAKYVAGIDKLTSAEINSLLAKYSKYP